MGEVVEVGMRFDELDGTTRRYMLEEFLAEEAGGNPYRGKNLSIEGLKVFPRLMRDAIEQGDEGTLSAALSDSHFWNPTEVYVRDGIPRDRKINVLQAAQRLAGSEFNTWYVRGLSRRLLDEGVVECEVYRTAQPKWEPAECREHEGQILAVQDVYDGHRARYWPEPGTQGVVCVPFQPGCHHSIRRISSSAGS